MMLRFLASLSLIALSVNLSAAQCTSYDDGYNQYDVSICPLAANAQPPVIERQDFWNMPSESYDTGVSSMYRFNFSVWIYGVPHRTFLINTNGAVYFGSVGASTTT
jgi:hypothetical protein